MRWFPSWRKDRDEDLERELRSDLELEAAELQENGLSAEDARYAARRALGNRTLIKEDVRRAWGSMWLEDFINDVRYSARDLRKSPGFAVSAILSLALSIGANTAIFTIVNAVLLKSLPVRDPGSLVVLGPYHGSGDEVGIPDDGSFSLYSYDLYTKLSKTKIFTDLCAVQSTTETDMSVRRPGWRAAERAQVRLVSGNYFDVLGTNAVMGRVFTSRDDSASAAPVGIISYRYWKGRLGADPSVLGSNIYIGPTTFTVVGIAPPGFYGETLRADPPDVWLPLSADRLINGERALIDKADDHWLNLIGRLAQGVTIASAQPRLNAALRNWLFALEGSKISAPDRAQILRAHIILTPGGSGLRRMQRDYSLSLNVLLGISFAILLITCANVANLLLARGTARLAETSVRLALGASRWRVIRQSLTESLVLAIAGGTLGLWIASFGSKLMIALFFRGSEYVPISTSPELRVLAFTLLLSCAAALLFGVLPAMRTTSNLSPVIKGASPRIKGSRISVRAFTLGPALIVAEVVLSVIVLVSAGAFARTLANLSGQKFGFDPNRLLFINLDTAHAGYGLNRLIPLYSKLYSRLNSLPRVKSASLAYYAPFDGCCWAFSISVQGHTAKFGEHTHPMLNRVSPRYFETVGTKILLGRDFDERDSGSSRSVAVVNQEFVRRYLANVKPIGQHFGIGGTKHVGDLEIVGVVANSKYDSPRDENMPMAFFPFLQSLHDDVTSSESNYASVIVLRYASRPETVAADVRHVLSEIDPDLAVLRISTASENINLMLNQENVVASLATFFGGVALFLSCFGLYGLMAYTVQRRTSEIGIRIALGARRRSVIGMVIKQAVAQGFAGVLIGIPAGIAALRLAAGSLYGVSPNDPRYFVAPPTLLLLCLVAAAYVPALRAARVDPLRALRYE